MNTERIYRRASIEGDGGERVQLVLLRRPWGADRELRYMWHEEATGNGCEQNARTLKQAEADALALWDYRDSIWKFRWEK